MKTKANNTGISGNLQDLIGAALVFFLWLALPATGVRALSAFCDGAGRQAVEAPRNSTQSFFSHCFECGFATSASEVPVCDTTAPSNIVFSVVKPCTALVFPAATPVLQTPQTNASRSQMPWPVQNRSTTILNCCVHLASRTPERSGHSAADEGGEKMPLQVSTFCVVEIPDIDRPESKKAAAGNVKGAVTDGFMRLLRRVASERPGRVAVTLRFNHAPLSVVHHRVQARLVLSLMLACPSDAIAHWDNLIERGVLRRFYPFRRGSPRPVPWDRLKALSHIVRRERLLPALHKPEFNPMALPYYYVIDPFESDDNADYSKLDYVLASVEENVCIDIAVESAGVIADELSTNTHYLQRLHDINWATNRDAGDGVVLPVSLEEGFFGFSRFGPAAREPYKRDPVADDVARLHKNLNESLVLPQIRFNVRLMAESADTANSLAFSLGHEVFKNGQFEVLSFSPKDSCFDETLRCAQQGLVAAVPSRSLSEKQHPKLYNGFLRLAQLAPPDELIGPFRLPIGTVPLRCVRRDTDPPLETPKEFIVFGYDQEVGYERSDGTYCGEPRGLAVADLNKHGLILGATQTFKTTMAMSLVPQCWRYHVPSLIIAPIKHDFRVLKILSTHPDPATRSLASALEVYTAGNNQVSPWRYNPIEIPEGISRDEHSANLLTCFHASMPLFGPMIALIAEGLTEVYDAFQERDRWPIIADLVDAIERVMNRAAYTGEVDVNLRAAFRVRLQSLCSGTMGKIFSSWISVPSLDHMFNTPTLIELEGLSQEQACLASLFLLTGMREYAKCRI
jgi:hypothetical protein